MGGGEFRGNPGQLDSRDVQDRPETGPDQSEQMKVLMF